MKAPLNRDQQIELMRNAQARHDARFATWMSVRAIREVVSRPAPGQDDGAYYSVDEVRVACG